jgi:hypothetical protein
MGSQVIPAGTYTLMGPGGRLTTDGERIILMQPGWDNPAAQQWQTAFDEGSGTYTLKSVLSGQYVGTDAPADTPDWMMRGTSRPYPWELSEGEDDDPDTFLVTSAAGGLRLAPSILRVYPPAVALGPPAAYYDFEWTFSRAA